MQIERLQREIERLQMAELGRASEAAAATPPQPPTRRNESFGELSRPAYSSSPPSRPRKDFTVQEQKTSSSTQEKKPGATPSFSSSSSSQFSGRSGPSSNVHAKFISMLLGLVGVCAVVLALTKLFQFMRSNDIQFTQDAPGNMMISFSELALHNTADDCWVGLHGNVYDLTRYAKRHPPGPGSITVLAGTDGTEDYDRFHSVDLLKSVKSDIIGILVDDGTGNNGNDTGNNGNGNSNGNGGGGGGVVDCSVDADCITLEEIQQHNSPNDYWMAIHGNVYDLTGYVNEHPGGRKWITDYSGMDATSDYGRFHGRGLLSQVSQYQIGRLEGSPTDPGTGNGGDMNGGGEPPSSPDDEDEDED